MSILQVYNPANADPLCSALKSTDIVDVNHSLVEESMTAAVLFVSVWVEVKDALTSVSLKSIERKRCLSFIDCCLQ